MSDFIKSYLKNSSPTLFKIIRFVYTKVRQAIGLILRPYQIKKYFSDHSTIKLCIGSGKDKRSGWLNTDYAPSMGVMYLDATRKFPFSEKSTDYIYTEHMIEHISLTYAKKMLEECFRVLRNGGVLRIATPDLNNMVRLLTDRTADETTRYSQWLNKTFGDAYAKKYFDNPCIAFNLAMHEWGHQFIFDEFTLRQLLNEVGFVDIVRCKLHESTRDAFKGIELHGIPENEDMTEFETMVIEASKP